MGTLRFLLAVAIVITHSSAIFGITSLDGISAVESFCIMSGFYMWMILNEKYIGQNNHYKLFITNRFLRIYPVYWVVLIVTIVVAVFEAVYCKYYHNPFAPYIAFRPLLSITTMVVLILSNLAIFGQDILCFLGFNMHNGSFLFNSQAGIQEEFMFVPQSWSLALELFFYLIVPILATKNIRITIGIIIFSFAFRFYMYFRGYNYIPWNCRFFPFEIALFLVGGICYLAYERIKQNNYSKLLLNSIWMGLLLVILLYQFIPGNDVKRWIFYTLFAAALPFIFYLTKNYKWDRYIGELSYPVFLTQMLVISILKQLNVSNRYIGLATIIFCSILSIIIYHYVTIPIERFRQSRVRKNN